MVVVMFRFAPSVVFAGLTGNELTEKAVDVFSILGFKYLFEPKILRHNFIYKGVELALKYSKTWGYHLELEVMISSLKQKEKVEKKIHSIAKELGVVAISDEELKKFTENIEKTYKNPRNIFSASR